MTPPKKLGEGGGLTVATGLVGDDDTVGRQGTAGVDDGEVVGAADVARCVTVARVCAGGLTGDDGRHCSGDGGGGNGLDELHVLENLGDGWGRGEL